MATWRRSWRLIAVAVVAGAVLGSGTASVPAAGDAGQPPAEPGKLLAAGTSESSEAAPAAESSAPDQAPPPRGPKGATNQQEAIDELGERLPEVAAAHDMTAADLRRIFLQDDSLYLDPSDRLLYVEPARTAAAPGGAGSEAAAPFPLSETFKLHSRPGSQRVIYLDFDGHTVSGTAWNGQYGTSRSGSFSNTAFNTEGSSSSFSTSEQEQVQSVWERVAEDYAPFDVDVTTEDPGADAIHRTNSSDQNYGTRVVITSNSPVGSSCQCGGVAYVDVFDLTGSNHSTYQPAFVFQQGLGGTSASSKSVAEAASHEAGHNLGLSHDGGPGTAYYSGHGAWAPIMGVSYYKPVTQWSKGEYGGANNHEDDLAIIASNGPSIVGDDHGGTTGASTALTDGVATAGLIGTSGDVDVFSFESSGGVVTIDAVPAPTSPDLDVSLEILNSAGVPLATSDPLSGFVTQDLASGLLASISQTLPAGTYYARVDGAGAGSPSTGYSDYASLGRYQITATAATGSNCSDDGSDDDLTTPRLLVPGQAVSDERCASDDDVIRVPALAGTGLHAGLSTVDANLTLQVLNGSGGVVSSANATPGTPGQLDYTIPAGGDHFLRVTGAAGAESAYDLSTSLSTACPPDDAFEVGTAGDLPETAIATTLPATINALSCGNDGPLGGGQYTNSDYYSVSLAAGGKLSASVIAPQSAGAVTLRLLRYPAGGTTAVATGSRTGDVITLEYTPGVTDDYQLQVLWSAGAVQYRLDASAQPGGPDAPPTVAITSPSAGSRVKGVVSLVASASDDNGVTRVEFFVDGASVGVDTNGSNGWSVTWDSAPLADKKNHLFTGVATDTASQTSTSAPVSAKIVPKRNR